MAEGLTEQELYLRRIDGMVLSTLPIGNGVTAGVPAHHDGAMVALVPDNPESLALQGDDALAAEDLHVTLCYLGKAHKLDNFDRTKILAAARKVCNELGHAFSSAADGVIVLGSNDEGVPATALLIQADEIVALYDGMVEALSFESTYPSFIPHMTTGYGTPVEEAQNLLGETITFSNVIVKFGDDKHTIPLSSSLVAAPRSVNTIDRVLDSLGRIWDEALHPRGDDGRFIKKNGAVSGKLFVPNLRTRDVKKVDANRASVVGFHTFDNDVWVLAEITNKDGSKVQGFAKADEVRAVAPVKARLDALYPVDNGPGANASVIERNRQRDLLLAHINQQYLSQGDSEGASDFLDTLGLHEDDLDYMFGGENTEPSTGLRLVERRLNSEELDEVADIIDDAQQVKGLRDRVHGLQEEAVDAHVVPRQQLPDTDVLATEAFVVDQLQGGADPLSIAAPNLTEAMRQSGRFEQPNVVGNPGISDIGWLVDENDQTNIPVALAGTGTTTTGRAYFTKKSVLGVESDNSDIMNEVLTSLMYEQIRDDVGDDDGLLPVPKSVFGSNPVWDGTHSGDDINQPGEVLSTHAAYAVPSDWNITTVTDEETSLYNDIRTMDDLGRADAIAAFKEDTGDVYGNSIAQMLLWDFIIMNGDRNPNNALLASPTGDGEGRVLPIDHGFAFSEEDAILFGNLDPDNYSPFQLFNFFIEEELTQGWLEYIRGGLDLNNNVTEESLQRTLQSALRQYESFDSRGVIEKFRSMPNVSDAQIERAEKALSGVDTRIEWLKDNINEVLMSIAER